MNKALVNLKLIEENIENIEKDLICKLKEKERINENNLNISNKIILKKDDQNCLFVKSRSLLEPNFNSNPIKFIHVNYVNIDIDTLLKTKNCKEIFH